MQTQNTCRLISRRRAREEGYEQFTGGIDRGTMAGKRLLESILRDARAAGRDHVCVDQGKWTVTVWEKGYIHIDCEQAHVEAEAARKDLVNAMDIGYRGISYVH